MKLLAVAAPADPEPVKLLSSEQDTKPDGGYVFGFESVDRVIRKEVGEVKEAFDEKNKPHQVVVVRGSCSVFDPEGNGQTINFFADETGYHAEGDAIPKAPVRR